MSNLKIFCVTDKELDFLAESKYSIGWVGKKIPQKITLLATKTKIFFQKKNITQN